MLRFRVNRELLRLLGVKYEEAKKLGLILAVAVAGVGAAVVAMGFLTKQTLFAVAGVAVILMAPVLYLYPVLEASSRVRRLEGELLPVSVYASIYTSAERDMTEGLLAFMRRENREIAPTVNAFVTNLEKWRVQRLIATPHEALGEAAKLFEGSKVADVLNSMAVARTVGISQYLQARDILKSVLFELKAAYQRLADNVKLIGEVVLVFFGVMPLMFMIMLSLFYNPATAMQLPAYVFLGIPLVGVALAFLVDSAYPKTPEKFTRFYKAYLPAVGVGVGVGVAAFFALSAALPSVKLQFASLNQSPGLYSFVASGVKSAYVLAASVAAGALAFAAVALPKYLAYSRWRWQVISALPYFTRDLAELIKIGLAPAQAVMRLAERKSYNRAFDGVLKNVARRIAAGATFSEAVVHEAARLPWLAAVLFNSLGEAERMGAKHDTFADLADVSRDVVDISKAAKASTRGAVIFGVVTIVIIGVLLGVVAKSLLFQVADYGSSFKSSLTGRGGVAIPLNINLIDWYGVPEVLKYSLIGAVVNALVLGILISKISDGNFTSVPLYTALASAFVFGVLIASIWL